MLLTIFNYLFLFQRYSSFLNMQISQVMMSNEVRPEGETLFNEVKDAKTFLKVEVSLLKNKTVFMYY